jgi:nucleotide-binding universal stress UspA family protein
MYRIILAAVDWSDRAEPVLRKAARLGEVFGSRVHLFHCVVLEGSAPLPGAAERAALERLEELAALYPEVWIEEPRLASNAPWRDIVEAATRLDADLIVLGAHAHDGWDRLFGKTADKVFDRAGRDCLVVEQP